jgi:ferredoxin
MKIRIDKPNCVGHARCAAIAPEHFLLDAEGYIAIDGFHVPEPDKVLVRRAARACPERVISVTED